MKTIYRFFKLIISPSFLNSLLGKPTIKGEAYPWLTKPTIHYLESLNLEGKRVLEFGSGYSTEYFDRRGCHVISYEREKYWINFLKKKVSSRTQIRHFNDDSKDGNKVYFSDIKKSLSNELFDILVVDVYPRPLTFEYYASLVKDGGIIIFDNSDWYPVFFDGIKKSAGYFCIDFWGRPVGDVRYQCTSIIYKTKFKELAPCFNAPIFSDKNRS